MRMRCLVALLVFAAAPARGLEPDAGVWRHDGPEGGAIHAVAVDPGDQNVLYAATREGGIFRSTNAGSRWGFAGAINYSQPDLFDREGPGVLLVDPTNGSSLLAGTPAGIYRSSDGGRTWSATTEGIGSFWINALAADPLDPLVLYAGTGHGARGQGLFKSTDGGATWRGSAAGLGIRSGAVVIHSVIPDPRTPAVLYLGTSNGRDAGVFRSTDGGATFTERNDGLQPDFDGAGALALDPSRPDTLYVATIHGLSRTTDAGASWSRLADGNRLSQELALDASTNPPTLYRRSDYTFLSRSTDEGRHWDDASPRDPAGVGALSLFLDPKRPGTLLLGSVRDGVFRSTDGGQSWKSGISGLVATDVDAVAWSPDESALAATPRGVLRSTDGGASWTATSFPGSASLVAPDPRNPAVLLAAGNPGPPEYPGLFRTSDGGRSWARSDAGLVYGYRVQSVVVSPSDPRVVYATTHDGECAAPLSRSTDGGLTWQRRSPAGPNACLGAYVLAVDPRSSPTIWIATAPGLTRSTDGGRTWTPRLGSPGEPLSVSSLAVGRPARRLWAATNRGIYRSTDSGETWVPGNVGLPDSAGAIAVASDPSCPVIVYASIATLRPESYEIVDHGIFRSTDEGASWRQFNEGLQNRRVAAFAISSDGSRVLAATLGGGVARLEAAPASCGEKPPPRRGPDRP